MICLENVSGLVSAHNGEDYRHLHQALVNRGYTVGAVLINASHFVPQSRPRVFVIGTKGPIPGCLSGDGPIWPIHLHFKSLLQRLTASFGGTCRSPNVALRISMMLLSNRFLLTKMMLRRSFPRTICGSSKSRGENMQLVTDARATADRF